MIVPVFPDSRSIQSGLPPYRIHKYRLSDSVRGRKAPRRFCILRFFVLFNGAMVALLALSAGTARAADPQPYKVNIQGTGSGELDGALRSSSQLASLQDKVPVPPFALVQRALALALLDLPRLRRPLPVLAAARPFHLPLPAPAPLPARLRSLLLPALRPRPSLVTRLLQS